jgi:hypothetical protein
LGIQADVLRIIISVKKVAKFLILCFFIPI